MSLRSTSTAQPMKTTKAFEGPDLGVLLDEVRAEFGDAATVVAANRCRSGGFAGLFATESFEVIVELPNAAPAATGPRQSRLAARAAARSTPSPTALAAPAQASAGSSSLDALVEAADRAERDGAALSTRKIEAADRAERDGAALSTRTVSPIGAFEAAMRRAEVEQRSVNAMTSVPTKRGWRRPAAPRPKRRSKRSSRGDQERVIDLAALERAGLMPSLNPASVTSVEGRDVRDGRDAGTGLGSLRRGSEVSVHALLSLGVPSTLLASAEHGRINLANVIGRLPVPPPMITGHGVTIAFVGESSIVLDVARAVSIALHQDPDACVLLSPGPRPVGFTGEQISVIDDLSRRREEWSMLDRLTVVAIDIGFARQDVAWGRHAVSMLRPAMRWGVVAATRKADDVRSWSRGIGGLHALAVTGMADTASPASVLSSGVPVARLDGQVATPELWMRLLSDRLAEQTTRRTPDLIAT